jgi:flavin-dependent dehydrogenase
VTIVGASVAGLFTACLLARDGIPVQLYEQQDEIGPPARTLIVTGQFTRVLDSPADDVVVNHIHRFALHARDTSAHIELREPDLVIERSRLLQTLANQARQDGVRIVTGHRLEGVHVDGGRPILTLVDKASGAAEEVTTGILVGADGAASRVARALDATNAPLVSIWQARVKLPPGSDPHTVDVWFDRRDTRFFYWLIPDSPTSGVLGLVAEDHARAKSNLQAFLRRHNLEPVDYQLALVPLHARGLRLWGRLGRVPVYLVGDAAAQVKVTTVGGVVSGLRGARAAARAIIRRTGYEAELRALQRELDLHLMARRVLDRFEDADYSRLLRLLGGPVRNVLAAYSRDELARSFWRVALAEPRWAIVAARAIIRSIIRS